MMPSANIHGFQFRPHMYTWVIWSETRQKWWHHLWTAPKCNKYPAWPILREAFSTYLEASWHHTQPESWINSPRGDKLFVFVKKRGNWCKHAWGICAKLGWNATAVYESLSLPKTASLSSWIQSKNWYWLQVSLPEFLNSEILEFWKSGILKLWKSRSRDFKKSRNLGIQ